MAQDRYISELPEKINTSISGEYLCVVQEPNGQANTTYRLSLTELVAWLQNNTDYSEAIGIPISNELETGDTIITIGNPDSPSQIEEIIRLKKTGRKIGILTTTPQSTIELWTSDSDNGDLMIAPESGERMGFHVEPRESDSPESSAKFHIGRKIHSEDSSFVPLVTVEESGNTLITGGTQLGDSSSPAVKLIKLTGTTGSTGSPLEVSVSVAHGIADHTKIISFHPQVLSTDDIWVLPNDTVFDGCQFSASIDTTNLIVQLSYEDESPNNSSCHKIEEQPFICTILYEV